MCLDAFKVFLCFVFRRLIIDEDHYILCILTNLGKFYHCNFQIFCLACCSFLLFKDSDDINIKPCDIGPEVPETLFIKKTNKHFFLCVVQIG